MPGDYRQPTKREYERLPHDVAHGIGIARGQKFETDIRAAINRFKSGVVPHDKPLALKYSGLYRRAPGAGHTCMLGWDHAAHLQREAGGDRRYVLRAIYSHSYSHGAPETMAHRLGDTPGQSALLLEAPETVTLSATEHDCGTHAGRDCSWRKYALPAPGSEGAIVLDELITFSITSCSFVCLFDEPKDNLFISHMAFAPLIPVAWLAVRELQLPERTPMRLLASVNSTTEELAKITTPPRFPWADRLAIESVLLLRGREGLNVFMTHPYLGIDLNAPDNVAVRGALGYNNDPTRGFRELPPFHSILADLYPVFMAGTDARAILSATGRLLRDDFGYADLHEVTLNEIAMADLVYYKEHGDRWYSSPRLDKLLAQLKQPAPNDAPPLPPELQRWKDGARAALLLAELAANPDAPAVSWLKETVLDAWDKIQRGFRLELNHHADWVQPRPSGQSLPVGSVITIKLPEPV